MSAGKKGQRTKGNVKPSSSSRAAKFLQNEGQTGHLAFSSLASNAYCVAPHEKGDGFGIDGELRLLFRKMAKKDTITKLKAVQEFASFCKEKIPEKDSETMKSALDLWPRVYNKLAHDYDHRVREATQQAHYELVIKAGRNLAPYLKLIITNWLMCQFDTHYSAALQAKMAFNEVFPEKKTEEVLSYCKMEILQNCEKNILKETADTLSDPKVVSLEEREAKYNRFVSSSFLLLKYFFDNISQEGENDVVENTVKNLFGSKKFWKFAKHESPLIRSSVFSFLTTSFEQLTSLVEESLTSVSATLLTNIDEEERSVVSFLWEAVLCLLSKFENIWQHVNVRKAVWPKLWKLLKCAGYHNTDIVFPNLLPLLSKIPPEVANGIGFYEEFFNNIMEGLDAKHALLSESNKKLLVKSYMECLRYMLLKSDTREELYHTIVNNLLGACLLKIFHSQKEEKWHPVFINEFSELIYFVNEEINKDNNYDFSHSLHNDLWNVISGIIFRKTGDDIELAANHINFSQLLIHFLSCYSCNYLPDSGNEKLEKINDASSWIFMQCVLRCYLMEVFQRKHYHFGEHLMRLILLTRNIELIKLACFETLRLNGDSEKLNGNFSTVDIFICFLNSVALPLLSTDVKFKTIISDISIDFMDMLHGEDKQLYLVAIFENDLLAADISLFFLVKVFDRLEEESVLKWLKNDFVESVIENLCNAGNVKSDEGEYLKWKILRKYIEVFGDDPEKKSLYANKILHLMKYYFGSIEKSEKEVDYAVLETFIAVSEHIFETSDTFLETWFAMFMSYISRGVNCLSVEAVNDGFMKMLIVEGNHFSKIASKLLTYVKENSMDDEHCTRLCESLYSLLQFSEDQLREVSHGKKVLDEIFTADEKFGEYQVSEKLKISKFYSRFSKIISERSNSLLQLCCEDKLNNLILLCLSIGIELENEMIIKDMKGCIHCSDFIHFNLMDKAIRRCLDEINDTAVIKILLQTLFDDGQLSESIIDHCLMVSAPSKYEYAGISCDAYSVIVSIVDDISCIRALVEMYVDELKNNDNVKSNSGAFGGFLKVLSTVISRWYVLLCNDGSDHVKFEDYNNIVPIIMDNVLRWKEDHSEMILFSCLLTQVNPSVIVLNINVIQLLSQLVDTSLAVLRSEHRDFLLCSMISWIQTCEDSLDCFDVKPLFLQFMHKSFELFNIVAYSYNFSIDSSSTLSPCIRSKKLAATPASLSDDSVTEWIEFFLPTVSTSLLRIYERRMKQGNCRSKHVEFEKMICCCIHYVPCGTLNEFVLGGSEGNEKKKVLEDFTSVLCDNLKNGEWWDKIASYQLLTGLGDAIESLLCVTQKEDEDHEGCRSFPFSLMDTMESSRDETLKILCGEEISLKEPLKSFHQEEGKRSLFTYLLSWQLILQLFKASDSTNRAMFANYLCKNNDIHDLITCLFCIMPRKDFDCKQEVSLTHFSYSEIQQVAFNLLLTAMESIPALIRKWFNNNVSRTDTGTVNKFVATFISPILLKKEFQTLNESSKEFNNMIVKTRSTAREVAAIYMVDEVSMELVVELAADHPLSPVAVTCGKRIGVSNSLWRQWMLQLNTFLSFQNGSILDGLALWKRNVDKRFEGVEECMVCFSVLHGSNYSLPSIACKTCKKKFHPACLYKWFNTSGKSTCPLCRNVF